jgi:dihydrofolate reductase
MTTNRIIVWMQSSLDGFSSGPDGEFDWPAIGEEVHTHFVTTLRSAGAFVYGRAVFEMMAGFWPIADTLPGSSPNQAAYARIWRPMPKVVLSRTLTEADWNATVIAEAERLRELADAADGDTYVFGGSRTVAALEAAGVVDEYQVFTHPVLLGAGRPFFAPRPERARLRLVESRVFDASVVASRYAREDAI